MASHTNDLHGPGARWAAALRRAYPGRSQAKQVALAFGVDVRTAESWLGGQAPRIGPLIAAVTLHGAAFALAVLVPPAPATEHEVRRIRRAGAALGDQLQQLDQARVQIKTRP